MSLAALVEKQRWSPRAEFPASIKLADRIFALGSGLYLMTNPRYGDGDPVRAIGWAVSDYWARRVWEVPPFGGELVTPMPESPQLPSLTFLGRPEKLSFKAVYDFESGQDGAKKATLVSATYRLTDGAFLCCRIKGAHGVTYFFESSDPSPTEEPVAIEFRLPE